MSSNGLSDHITLGNGYKFNLENIRENKLDIHLVFSCLAKICRFSGNTKFFYSVLLHSINVYNIVKFLYKANKYTRMAALFHDAAEFIIGDVPSPVKRKFPNIVEFENEILDWVMGELGIDVSQVDFRIIKKADALALKIELSVLFGVDNVDNGEGVNSIEIINKTGFSFFDGPDLVNLKLVDYAIQLVENEKSLNN